MRRALAPSLFIIATLAHCLSCVSATDASHQSSAPGVPGATVRRVALHREPPEHHMASFHPGRPRRIRLPAWPLAGLCRPRQWQVDHGQLARFVLKPAACEGSRWIHAGIGLNTDRVRVLLFPVWGDWLLRAGDRGRRCAQRNTQAGEETVSRDWGLIARARSHS